jgi:hypothetical protein
MIHSLPRLVIFMLSIRTDFPTESPFTKTLIMPGASVGIEETHMAPKVSYLSSSICIWYLPRRAWVPLSNTKTMPTAAVACVKHFRSALHVTNDHLYQPPLALSELLLEEYKERRQKEKEESNVITLPTSAQQAASIEKDLVISFLFCDLAALIIS